MWKADKAQRAAKSPSPALLAAAFAAVVAVAALVGVLLAQAGRGAAVSRTQGAASASAQDEGFGESILLDGVEYLPNRDLTTVLFLGIDQSQEDYDPNTVLHQGRSDTMLLFILNSADNTAQVLEISRDTMVDVDIYDNNQNIISTSTMQLTMQYAFGDSPRRGCWLTKNKVSALLYGTDVDYTLSFTMDGIAPVVDAMGGVSLTFGEGDTAVDPSYTAGSTLLLDGAAAERYIRWRDTAQAGSNNDRMARQSRLLTQLASQLTQGGNAQTRLELLQTAAAPYLETDLDAETIRQLAECQLSGQVYTLPGENREGEYHDEYYVDEDALRRLVVQLFYQPAA